MPQGPPEGISRLCDELATFDAAKSDAALKFLLSETVRLIGADNGMWVGAVRMSHGAAARRDLLHGWRGRAVRLLNPAAERLQQAVRASREQDTPQTSMTTIAVAAAAGKFRTVRLHELVDMA